MTQFKKISPKDDIKSVIRDTFDQDLDISGAWGYTQNEAIIIEIKQTNLTHFEHTLIMMRSYIEMNMTLGNEDRYAGINLSELSRETLKDNSCLFDKITYKVSAIKESKYNDFIKEYKSNFEKNDFDLGEHFKRRSESTLNREITCWFDITKTI